MNVCTLFRYTFFTNKYFLVCIFKYRTSSREFHCYFNVDSGLGIQGYCFQSNNLRIRKSKKREQHQQEQQRLVSYTLLHLSVVCDGLCGKFFFFPVCYSAIQYTPVHSHAFAVHLNWMFLYIIFQSCAILCACYGLESDFVVDSPSPCVINVIDSNRPQLDVSYSYKWALE